MKTDEKLIFNEPYWIGQLGSRFFAGFNTKQRKPLPIYDFIMRDGSQLSVLTTNVYFATEYTAHEVNRWEIEHNVKIDVVMLPGWNGESIFATKELQQKYKFIFLTYKTMRKLLHESLSAEDFIRKAISYQK